MGLTFIKTGSGAISAYVKGRAVTIPPDYKFYDKVLDACRTGDEAAFLRFSNIGEEISNFVKEDNDVRLITVENGVVYYKNVLPVHNTITERILNFIQDGLPHMPLVRFLERLLENPSRHSVEQLYRFLEHQYLPITEDGCFLAYKRVNDDWLDFHTQKILNKIGTTVSMNRADVDTDHSNDCSSGLHVGAIDYVRNFGSNGHILVVKVDPKNAVSVPEGHTNKMRVCEYFIVEEYTGDLTESLYTSASPVVPYSGPAPTEEDQDDDDQYEEVDDEEEEEKEEDSEDSWEEDSWEEDEDDIEEDSDVEDEDEEEDEEFDGPSDKDLDTSAVLERDRLDRIGIRTERLAEKLQEKGIATFYLQFPVVEQAIKDGNGGAFVRYLYGQAMHRNDWTSTGILEDQSVVAELIEICSQ